MKTSINLIIRENVKLKDKTILIYLFVFLFLTPSFSSVKDEGLIVEIKAKTLEASKIAKEQRLALGNLFKINKEIKTLSLKSDKLEKKIASNRQKAKRAYTKYKEIKEELSQKKDKLYERLRTLYKIKKVGKIRFLYAALKSDNFNKNIYIIKSMADKDITLISDYKKVLKEQKAIKNALQETIEKLEKSKRNFSKNNQILTKAFNLKKSAVESLRKKYAANLDQIHLDKQKLSKSVLSYLKPQIFEKKGLLNLPIKAPIVKDYGYEKNKEYGYVIRNKGLLFSAQNRKDVESVFSGTVVFSGFFPSYKKLVIIDHGDNYYTSYGLLHDVKVKKGDKVKAGETLASTSKRKNKYNLYFEIRHFSEPLDPADWLSGEEVFIKNELASR